MVKVSKKLIVSEDISTGIGKEIQVRNNTEYEVTKLNVTELNGMLVVNTKAELDLIDVTKLKNSTVLVEETGYIYKYKINSWEFVDTLVVVKDTIADLKAMVETPKRVHVLGYNTKVDGAYGSNAFALRDGVIPDGTYDNTGTTHESKNGVYDLVFDGYAKAEYFGAIGYNNITTDSIDSTSSILQGLSVYDTLEFSNKWYKLNNSIPLANKTLIFNYTKFATSHHNVFDIIGNTNLIGNYTIVSETSSTVELEGIIRVHGNNDYEFANLGNPSISSVGGHNNAVSVDATNCSIENVSIGKLKAENIGRICMEVISHIEDGSNYISNLTVGSINAKNLGVNSQYGMGLSISGNIHSFNIGDVFVNTYKDIGLEFASTGTGLIKRAKILNPTTNTDFAIQSSVNSSYTLANDNIQILQLEANGGRMGIVGTNFNILGGKLSGMDDIVISGKVKFSSMQATNTKLISVTAGNSLVIDSKSNLHFADSYSAFLTGAAGSEIVIKDSIISDDSKTPLVSYGDTLLYNAELLGGQIKTESGSLTLVDTDINLTASNPIQGAHSGNEVYVRTKINGSLVKEVGLPFLKTFTREIYSDTFSVSVHLPDNNGWRPLVVYLDALAIDSELAFEAHYFNKRYGRVYTNSGVVMSDSTNIDNVGFTVSEAFDSDTNILTYTFVSNTAPAYFMAVSYSIKVDYSGIVNIA